ncbi:MAG TPA: helix-turn-helix domain-containing protein, partial [Polyangiaceae bacterium]|nr:helix-turn-helix domain-containing protein [Polyangiaceae bacterium]
APLLDWMRAHVGRPLTLERLAARASMSPRTLHRRFKEQTGTTPLQWLAGARMRRARELLETTRLSVDEVAAAVGFDGASGFRERFRRTVGVAPNAYRRTFQGDAPGDERAPPCAPRRA